jgi:hypothetical protein
MVRAFIASILSSTPLALYMCVMMQWRHVPRQLRRGFVGNSTDMIEQVYEYIAEHYATPAN